MQIHSAKWIVFLMLLPCTGCAAVAEGIHEPEWSRRIAVERGLDPDTACEVATPDGSRADIVDADYAWEVEWAYNWKEAPGQAVFYAITLNRKPGVILLIKSTADNDEYLRCLAVCSAIRVNGEPIRLEVYKIK